MRHRAYRWLCAAGLGVALICTDTAGLVGPSLSLVADAQAKVGHPATPRSAAAIARRTTRRVIRRSTVYVSALPRGCARTNVNGVVIWRCGSTYYQAYGKRYVVVYIN